MSRVFRQALFGALLGSCLMPAAFAQAPVSGAPSATASPTAAQVRFGETFSGRLLLTGGVNTIEGASGGGLVPWATIGGYGTRDQVGGTAFATYVRTQDYAVGSAGAVIGIANRLELSYARMSFNTRDVGADLGIGRNFTFDQDVFGAKLRLFGDLLLNQDSLLPQVAIGGFWRQNNRGDLVRALGARRDADAEFYISATRLFLAESVLVNATLRATRANQFGFLGFGGDRNDNFRVLPEVSAAYLINRNLAIGAEFRFKPNNLGIAREDSAYSAFIAYAPTRNISLTLAYVDLGRIVTTDVQRGVYLSLNVGF